jgi:hypothetical protein
MPLNIVQKILTGIYMENMHQIHPAIPLRQTYIKGSTIPDAKLRI